MIALHFPEGIWQAKTEGEKEIKKKYHYYKFTMYRPQRESFVIIQVRGCETSVHQDETPQAGLKLNFSAMKLFHRFRKIIMRLLFSIPPGETSGTSSMGTKQKKCDRFDPPKTSCSSHYSSQSHYTEAIADCIEFFNKSSQEGTLDGRKSDVLV